MFWVLGGPLTGNTAEGAGPVGHWMTLVEVLERLVHWYCEVSLLRGSVRRIGHPRCCLILTLETTALPVMLKSWTSTCLKDCSVGSLTVKPGWVMTSHLLGFRWRPRSPRSYYYYYYLFWNGKEILTMLSSLFTIFYLTFFENCNFMMSCTTMFRFVVLLFAAEFRSVAVARAHRRMQGRAPCSLAGNRTAACWVLQRIWPAATSAGVLHGPYQSRHLCQACHNGVMSVSCFHCCTLALHRSAVYLCIKLQNRKPLSCIIF